MATAEDPRTETGTDAWRRELYDAKPEREGELYSTISGIENEPLYSPDNVDVEYERDLGKARSGPESHLDLDQRSGATTVRELNSRQPDPGVLGHALFFRKGK